MSRTLVIAAALLAGGVGLAEDPKPVPVKADTPKLWDLPTTPVVPTPMPSSDAVTVLDPGVLLVVTHTDECVVDAFPRGKLRIVSHEVKTGQTLILPAKYYDGGRVVEEDREFKGPLWVYRARAETSGVDAGGDCDLMVLPVGGRQKDMQVRRVRANVGPQPPPPKPVDPKPVDPKPVDPPVTEKSPWDNAPGLRVLIVYPNHGTLPAAQQSIVTGARVRKYLDENTAKESGEPAYWILKTDEDVTGLTPAWQKAYGLAKGDRWVVAGNGAKWESVALPENPDKMLEFLGRIK